MAKGPGRLETGKVQEEAPVQKAISMLMEEHSRIEHVLGSLEGFASALAGGTASDRERVGRYAAFFRGFADVCHHAKEEDVLFQRLVERGFSRETGPVAVMLYEHEVGRAHVGALRQVAEVGGALSAAEARQVVDEASGFVPLLRAHILKEDRILYPMALRVLSGPELDEMAEAFLARDRARREDGTWDRLQATAEELLASFPPGPVRTAEAAAMP